MLWWRCNSAVTLHSKMAVMSLSWDSPHGRQLLTQGKMIPQDGAVALLMQASMERLSSTLMTPCLGCSPSRVLQSGTSSLHAAAGIFITHATLWTKLAKQDPNIFKHEENTCLKPTLFWCCSELSNLEAEVWNSQWEDELKDFLGQQRKPQKQRRDKLGNSHTSPTRLCHAKRDQARIQSRDPSAQEWQMDRESQLLSSLVWKVPLPGELELDSLLKSLSIHSVILWIILWIIHHYDTDHNNII